MNPWRDEAVVLGSRKSNEANRVVILLTKEHGRVAVAAHGVRKSKSRIGARLEPMCHVDVLVKPGRGLSSVDEVRMVSVHSRLHSDLGRMSQGLAMLEVVDRMTPDGVPVPAYFEILSRALATLNESASPLVLAAFYWKLLALEGSAPQLEECVRCGTADDLVGFEMLDGGVTCSGCRMGPSVSRACLEIMRMILGGRLREALDLEESPAVHEVNLLAMNAMEAHLERRIRSLSVFDRHL